MSKTRREKSLNLPCMFEWGGTEDLEPWDSGWACAHYCRQPIDHEGPHVCCRAAGGSHER